MLKWFEKHKKFCMCIFAFVLIISVTAAITPSILSTNQTGGGTFQTTDETADLDENNNSNVDNSDEETSTSDATDGGEVTADTANDLGVYSGQTDDDGNDVVYWISDSSYYSTSAFSGGSGTSSSPYLISCAEDLAYLSYVVFTGEEFTYTTYFEQTDDIDLSGTEYNANGLYWMPIGGHCSSGYSSSYQFYGNYDGGGHVVSGLKTYNDGTTYSNCMGLFGIVYNIYSTKIHDIGIENSVVSGYDYVGAIVGWMHYSSSNNSSKFIYNCYNTGSVTGNGYVGGIVGQCNYSEILNCYNMGTVNSTSRYVGGIVGQTTGVYICNCYNTGMVVGLSCSGGLVGYLGHSTSSLDYLYNSFNVGDVTATSTSSSGYIYVGGIVGYGGSSTISYCYYFCTILGNGNSYTWGIGNTTDTDGVTESLTNLSTLAQTESWFTTSSNWKTSYPWDFDYVWEVNGGYPTFNIRGETVYTITYSASGLVGFSSSTVTMQNVAYGLSFKTLKSSTFSTNGYYVAGWSTTKPTAVATSFSGKYTGTSFTGTSGTYWSYSTSYVYNYAGDITLYAVWMLESYTLTYNSNYTAIDSSLTNSTSTQNVTYKTSFTTKSDSVFSYTGYSIVGWSTTQTSEVVTEFAGNVSGTSYTGAGGTYWSCSTNYVYNMTSGDILYAVWAETVVNYDEDGNYWYFEDGYAAQGGCEEPSGVSATGTSFEIAVGRNTASVVMFSDGTDEYAYVTIGDESAWFVVEPIRWIVAYGEDEPTSYDVAVSAYVLTCGSVSSSAAGSGWDWTSSALLDSVDDLESATTFSIANDASWGYDAFVSTVGQSFVTDDASSATSVVSVASVEEIGALGGTYKAQCSDFVAFLLSGGTTTSGYVVDYWTRDLAYDLDGDSYYGSKFGASSYQGYYNSGVYVGADGLISNAWLTETMGARLAVKIG